jgi:hypothetical protein
MVSLQFTDLNVIFVHRQLALVMLFEYLSLVEFFTDLILLCELQKLLEEVRIAEYWSCKTFLKNFTAATPEGNHALGLVLFVFPFDQLENRFACHTTVA